MAENEVALGGRLPLFDRDAISAEQKQLFDWLTANVVPWTESPGFLARTESGQFIGPFNPALLTPSISQSFFDFQVAEQKHTSLDDRCREVVILTVGAVWQAPYELYAHSVVGRYVGLSDDAVRVLAVGALPEDLRVEEAVAHQVARSLSVEHRLDDALYRKAMSHFGPDGLMDIIVLCGIYHTVCGILNGFAIPAPS
jgi:4-carboxymuconolactone decarboxylase